MIMRFVFVCVRVACDQQCTVHLVLFDYQLVVLFISQRFLHISNRSAAVPYSSQGPKGVESLEVET